MNKIIKINYDSEQPTVLGRDLHKALEVQTPYDKWFPRMCEYGFEINKDYSTFLSDRIDGKAGKPRTDHQLTIPMAKEICMLQRSEKGKMFRQYFINIEEQWNTPEAVMARALKYANENLKKLQIKVSELSVDNQIMKPKADYFDELVERNLLTGIRETAKQLEIKQNKFVSFLLEHKYVYRDKKGKLMPYAKHIDGGLFELKECFNDKTQWSGTQPLITPKGRETFRLLFINNAQ